MTETNTAIAKLDRLKEALGHVIRGKDSAIELLIVGLLADGHVLIEDVPGVGKTTLAKALSRAIRADFMRIQFTPDLLPADILGASVLDPREGSFSFQPGPVFTHLLLADEINRASPRTQSALLEAMNEAQVTVDGKTRALPRPFFVIATQNPVDFQGTYPLPEAQLDRFLLRLDLGYPSEEQELGILVSRQLVDPLDALEGITDLDEIRDIQDGVRKITIDEDIAKYIVRIVRATRSERDLEVGVSPRGALALFRTSQARALVSGRSHVTPDDVQKLATSVLAHRVLLTSQARYGGRSAREIIATVVEKQDVPR